MTPNGQNDPLPRLGQAAFELAPALRVGIPATAEGAPVRLEFAVAAAGAVSDRFSFVADAGLRLWRNGEEVRAGAPGSQGFLLAGATMARAPTSTRSAAS